MNGESMAPPPAPAAVEYPEADGLPMAESDIHTNTMVDTQLLIHSASSAEPILTRHEAEVVRRRAALDILRKLTPPPR